MFDLILSVVILAVLLFGIWSVAALLIQSIIALVRVMVNLIGAVVLLSLLVWIIIPLLR